MKYIQPYWDQAEFHAFYDGLPATRREEDEARLLDLFNTPAARQPLFSSVLEWAGLHGVSFFVDHLCTTHHGYYVRGTGVVAVAEERLTQSPVHAISTIAHETVHAWQDARGLMPAPSQMNFLPYYISLGALEAAATACEYVTAWQAARVQLGVTLAGNISPLADCAARWYDPQKTNRAAFVGQTAAAMFHGKLGLHARGESSGGGKTVAHGQEFTSTAGFLHRPEMSVRQRLEALNEDFKGRAVLGATAFDNFTRTILRPSLALRFYDAAKHVPDDIVMKILKAEGRRV